MDAQEKPTLKKKAQKKGLKGQKTKPQTDQDRKRQENVQKYKKGQKEGKQSDDKKPIK